MRSCAIGLIGLLATVSMLLRALLLQWGEREHASSKPIGRQSSRVDFAKPKAPPSTIHVPPRQSPKPKRYLLFDITFGNGVEPLHDSEELLAEQAHALLFFASLAVRLDRTLVLPAWANTSLLTSLDSQRPPHEVSLHGLTSASLEAFAKDDGGSPSMISRLVVIHAQRGCDCCTRWVDFATRDALWLGGRVVIRVQQSSCERSLHHDAANARRFFGHFPVLAFSGPSEELHMGDPALRAIEQQQHRQQKQQQGRPPRHGANTASADPHYEHTAAKLQLPAGVPLLARTPNVSIAGCVSSSFESAALVAVTFFTSSYEAQAQRLLASCRQVGICCAASLFADENSDAQTYARDRGISAKPLFIWRTLQSSLRPILWVDCDMIFLQNPSRLLTEQQGVDALLINSIAGRERTENAPPRVASNVAYFNPSTRALRLLEAWAEAMAFKLNALALDDGTLDVLLNLDGWLQRAKIGWLTVDDYACIGAARCNASKSAVLLHASAGKEGGGEARARVIPVLPPRALSPSD